MTPCIMGISKQDLDKMLNRVKSKGKAQDVPPFTHREPGAIFLPGMPRSSKNSKRAIRTKDGRNVAVSSHVAKKYMRSLAPHLISNHPKWLKAIEGLSPPYQVHLTIYADTRRKFDLTNIIQATQDCMSLTAYKRETDLPGGISRRMISSYQWIIDDDYVNFVPHFHPEVHIDKYHPGIYLRVVKSCAYEFTKIE